MLSNEELKKTEEEKSVGDGEIKGEIVSMIVSVDVNIRDCEGIIEVVVINMNVEVSNIGVNSEIEVTLLIIEDN